MTLAEIRARHLKDTADGKLTAIGPRVASCHYDRAVLLAMLNEAREALKFYAEVIYPDDGSGRPADAYAKPARAILTKLGD